MKFEIETEFKRDIYTLTLLQEKAKIRELGFKKFPSPIFKEFTEFKFSNDKVANFINDRAVSHLLLDKLKDFYEYLKHN